MTAVSRPALLLTLCTLLSACGERVPESGDIADTAATEESAGAEAAAAVIKQYYSAINARTYHRAYALWSDEGAASGQSLDEFSAGFTETQHVALEIETPGRVEGAAGSRYVSIPVIIRTRLTDGTEQRFAGTYTLRRSAVDGATPTQRAWRIHSADIAVDQAGRADVSGPALSTAPRMPARRVVALIQESPDANHAECCTHSAVRLQSVHSVRRHGRRSAQRSA